MKMRDWKKEYENMENKCFLDIPQSEISRRISELEILVLSGKTTPFDPDIHSELAFINSIKEETGCPPYDKERIPGKDYDLIIVKDLHMIEEGWEKNKKKIKDIFKDKNKYRVVVLLRDSSKFNEEYKEINFIKKRLSEKNVWSDVDEIEYQKKWKNLTNYKRKVESFIKIKDIPSENHISIYPAYATDQFIHDLFRSIQIRFFKDQIYEGIQANKGKTIEEIVSDLEKYTKIPSKTKKEALIYSLSYFDAISTQEVEPEESTTPDYSSMIKLISLLSKKGWNFDINGSSSKREFLERYENPGIGRITQVMTFGSVLVDLERGPASFDSNKYSTIILYDLIKDNFMFKSETSLYEDPYNFFLFFKDRMPKGIKRSLSHLIKKRIRKVQRKGPKPADYAKSFDYFQEIIEKSYRVYNAFYNEGLREIYLKKLGECGRTNVGEINFYEENIETLSILNEFSGLDPEFFLENEDEIMSRLPKEIIEEPVKVIDYIHLKRPETVIWEVQDWQLKEYIARGAYGPTFISEGLGGKIRVVKILDPSPDAIGDMMKIQKKEWEDKTSKRLQRIKEYRFNIRDALMSIINQEGMAQFEENLNDEEKEYILLPELFISEVTAADKSINTYASIINKLDTTLDKKLESGEYDSHDKYLPLIKDLLKAFSIIHKEREISYKGEICFKSFVHNDIKPSNIGFRRGQLKVFDFGIATTMQSSMPSNYPNIGSLEMRAPELEPVGDKPTTQSDVWQIGCLLYNIVAQNNPFDYKDRPKKTDPEKRLYFEEHERPKRIKEDLPKAIQHLRDIGTPEDLINIVSNCLKIDRQERYKDARHCLDDFKRHYDNIIKDYKKSK